jgi:cellulose synthase/poly-beta-1,6-N-acetylglucosamine synthase-like glycosyltransferase
MWFSNSIYYFKNKNQNHTDYVSIVIAAHNEEKNIPILLNSLIKQTYPNNKYEIIIANDRSTDNSKQIIKSYQQKNNNIKIININDTPIGWSNKKWALNKAIKLAQNNIIMQIDADCQPNLNWLTTMTSHFKDSRIGFVCGASPLIHRDLLLNNIFQMESLIQESINAGAIINNLVVSCTGRNIAFRKDVFNQVGGYIGNESVMSGDDDLLLQKFALQSDKKIKYSISSDSLVDSYAPVSFKNLIKQRLRFASKGLLYYKIKTTIELKSTIVILFLSNIIFVFSLINLFSIYNLSYIIPISIKILADFCLSWIFVNKLGRYWSLSAFTILTILHPFYIIIIGSLGPLLKVHWNNNNLPK